jgi:cell division protein ZapA (FtsZ GTPase activity inhibitor)
MTTDPHDQVATPRTDDPDTGYRAHYAEHEHNRELARTLERELIALRAELSRWQEDSMRQAATINRMHEAALDRDKVDEIRAKHTASDLSEARAKALKDCARLLDKVADENDISELGDLASEAFDANHRNRTMSDRLRAWNKVLADHIRSLATDQKGEG